MPTHAAGGILALLSAFAQDPCFDPCFDPCAAQVGGGRASATMHALARSAHASLPYHVQEARGCKWGAIARKSSRARGPAMRRARTHPTTARARRRSADSVSRHQRRAPPLSQQKNGARRRRWHRPRARRDRRGQERQQQKLAGAASATPPARRSRPGKEGNRSTRSHQLAKRCVTNASHRVVQTQRDPPATQPLRQLTERYTTPHEAVQASRSALCRPAAACCADLPSPPRPQPTRNPPGQ